MSRVIYKSLLLLVLTLFLVVTCTQPVGENPFQAKNTQVNIVLKSSDKNASPNVAIQDTVGKSIYFGINSNLFLNIDSVFFSKIAGTDTIPIITLKDISSRKYTDTIWNQLFLSDTGTITIIGKAFIHPDIRVSGFATVTILSRPLNHPPILMVPRQYSMHPGDTCTFVVTASDSDTYQVLAISAVHKPDSSAFDPQSHIFKWIAPVDFIGTDSIVFRVQDNGYPPAFDQKTVYLIVQTSFVNHPPVLTVKGFRYYTPGDTCILKLKAADPDPLQTVTISKLSGPQGSVLKDSIFTWVPPSPFDGKDSVIFVAKDDGLPPITVTEKVYITISNTIPLPSRPEGIKILSRIGNWVALQWRTSTTADSYRIFRAEANHAGVFTPIDTAYDTLCMDSVGLLSYKYYVKAYNKSGESPSSDTVVSLNINKAPKWQKDTINLVDTVGQTLKLTLSTLCSDPNSDTIGYSLMQGKPAGDTVFNGEYSCTPTALDTGALWPQIVAKDPKGLADTLTIRLTVFSAPGVNHKPKLTVSGARYIKNGTTCTLIAAAIDSDASQKLTYSMIKKPAGSTFNDTTGTFKWLTPASLKATDTVIFMVVDNGVPPLSDTATLFVVVSDTIINHPPKWQSDSVALNTSVGATVNLTLATICSDPDGDKISFSLIAGKPEGDTIKTGVYSFTPTAADTGSFRPRIIAKDSAGLMDTMLIKLTVTADDRQAPYVKLFSPSPDSSTVGASSATIKIVCKDMSGVASVKCSMGTDTFSVSNADSIYSATVTGLKSTGVNEILFIATDKSVNANRDTLKVHVKYVPQSTDTLSVSYNGNGSISGAVPIDTNHYKTGAKVTVLGNTGALARTGYTFLGWNTKNDGSGTSYASADTFAMGASNVTLYAKWTQKTAFTLTIIATNGSVTKSPNATAYDSGTVVTLTPVPANGYHFTEWSGGLTGTASPATITMNGAKSVTAGFAINPPNSFSLTVFATNGSVTKAPNLPQYDSGTVVSLTATPAAGYTFTGWSGGLTGSTNPASITMDAAKSVTATFAIKTFALTITAANGSVTKTPNAAQYDSGTVVSLTATPAAGYTFTGWSGGVTGTTNPASITMDAAKSVTATFAIKTFALTITAANGSVTKSPNAAQYDSGTVVSLTATPAGGYTFTGWSGGGLTGTTNPTSITMDAAKSVTATFAIKTFALTITAANGTVTKSPNAAQYDSGTVVSLTATPAGGYSFTGWSGGGLTGTTNPTSITMDAAKSVTATFGPIPCTITFNSQGTTYSTSTVNYGATVSAPTTSPTRSCYTFEAWCTDQGGLSQYNFLSAVTSSFTLYAKWTANGPYTVTFYSGGVQYSTASVNCGSTVSAPATPVQACSTFTAWYTNAGRTVQYNFATPVTSGFSLYAGWMSNSLSITNQPSPATWDCSIGFVNFSVQVSQTSNNTYTWYYNENGTTTECTGPYFRDYHTSTLMAMMPLQYGPTTLWCTVTNCSKTVTTNHVTLSYASITLAHRDGSAPLNFCITTPISVGNVPCAASYEWFVDWFNSGTYTSIDPNSTDIEGQGTATITCNSLAGSSVYCRVTDHAGNNVKSGVWNWASGSCH